MKKIGLLACCKRKSGKENPAQKFKAQDIYTGNTFKKSKTIGLRRFGCEDWHILSAKYGLLDKDDEISYYDMYLGCQPAAYKKAWAEKVVSRLKEKYDLTQTVFYIFGGADYYKRLLPHLHCFVFKYINSNVINFDDMTEYRFGGKSKMTFITEKNHNNQHITIHKLGCNQLFKNGGTENYNEFGNIDGAITYARKSNLPTVFCSFCKPADSQQAQKLDWRTLWQLAKTAKEEAIQSKDISSFDDLLRFYSNDGMVHYNLGQAYEALANYELAVKEYTVAKSLFPMQKWKNNADIAITRISQNMGRS